MSERERIWLPTGLVGFLATGCATVFYGTHQKIEVVTDPPGAMVTVYPSKDAYRSPTVLRLRRVGNYTIRITQDGFEPETVILDEAFAQDRAVFTMMLGLGLGGLVDLATGAVAEQVPGQIEVTLTPIPPWNGPDGPRRMTNPRR